jgi:hypothetical protein
MGTLGAILLLGVILFGVYYFLLPKKPFTYDGVTHKQSDVNQLRYLGGGLLLLFFIVYLIDA